MTSLLLKATCTVYIYGVVSSSKVVVTNLRVQSLKSVLGCCGFIHSLSPTCDLTAFKSHANVCFFLMRKYIVYYFFKIGGLFEIESVFQQLDHGGLYRSGVIPTLGGQGIHVGWVK